MTSYNEIPKHLKTQIEEIAKSDKFGINPKTIYQNIYTSTGRYPKLAEIFDVPIQLVYDIKELSE